MLHALLITGGSIPPAPSDFLRLVLDRLVLWRMRHRTRRQFAALDARALRDLGLSAAQQRTEVAKWFWQP